MSRHRASVERYELTVEGETFSAVRASDYDALEKRFDDYMDDYIAVINEGCAGDEKHCTCVPILRAEVERLRKELKSKQPRNGSVSMSVCGCWSQTWYDTGETNWVYCAAHKPAPGAALAGEKP